MNNSSHRRSPAWHSRVNSVATAFVFIAVGILFLAEELGWIDYNLFRYLVSWKMLLIVIGVVQLIKKQLIPGAVLIAVGAYFLMPHTIGFGIFFPSLFILVGVIILFKRPKIGGQISYEQTASTHSRNEDYQTFDSRDNGYVESNVTFGSVKHIVMEPEFKGAHLQASFGSLVLDLRRTTLQKPETFIDIDASFSGIVLFMPTHWNVIADMDTALGGYDDKRYFNHDIDNTHKVIIRGKAACSGIEIKS